MKTISALEAAAATTLLCAAPACAGGFRSIAKDLAAAARSHRIERVAVLPLAPADGSPERHGWSLSEKLVTRLVRTGKVQAVERTMLERLMEEQRLARTGAMDPATVRRLGRLVAAQGLVTGSFLVRGRRVVLHTRLIDIESGVILAASERDVERDWFELTAVGFGSDSREPRDAVEASAADEDLPWDTPEDDACAGAATRVDRLQARILDLKARYWAHRLKRGGKQRSPTIDPGSTISDPVLKQEFIDAVTVWTRSPELRPLDPAETRLFVAVDRRAFELHRKCRL